MLAACGGGGSSDSIIGGGATSPTGDSGPQTTLAADLSSLPPCDVTALDSATGTVNITFWHGMNGDLEDALTALTEALPAAVDAQLKRDAGLNAFEYQVMAGLSDAPGHAIRMSALAAFASGSLSRLSWRMNCWPASATSVRTSASTAQSSPVQTARSSWRVL